MVLIRDENDLLTRTGAGTPMGEVTRRTFSLEEIYTAFDLLDRGEVARSIIRY
jgi:Zn-dependent alcohol dehydrogenase